MDCNKIKEFIITDYIDRQMGDNQRISFDLHLRHCDSCQRFLVNIKKEAVNPFVHASKDFPEAVLWARIAQTIEEEKKQQLEESLKPDFWEKIRSAVHIPRPAFALATLVTMIFMIGTTDQLFFSNPIVRINGQDQVEYLSSLIDEPADFADNNGNDSKTPIEQYFL
jgi:hypothetical protein